MSMLSGQEMTKAKPKPRKVITARPQTKTVTVSHPTLGGAVERVERVTDTVELMHKRRKIDSHQFRAAERLHKAYMTLHGSPGGAMDFMRARGGGLPGSPPPLKHLMAAQTLDDFKDRTYRADRAVIELVVIRGHTLEQAADILMERKATRAEREETGRSMRAGLKALADHWWGAAEPAPEGDTRIYRAPDALKYTVQEGVVTRAKTVHATARKVFRNK